MRVTQPIEWTDAGVVMLDQRRLPAEVIRHTYTKYGEVADAIRDMVIRGAPAIGVAAAMGVAIGVKNSSVEKCRRAARRIPDHLRHARADAADRRGFILGDRPDETPLRRTRAVERSGNRFAAKWSPKRNKFTRKNGPPTKPSENSAPRSCPPTDK